MISRKKPQSVLFGRLAVEMLMRGIGFGAGLVHRAVMTDWPDLSAHQVYACGAPAMIEAARADFTQRCGLPDTAFFADAFTFASDIKP